MKPSLITSLALGAISVIMSVFVLFVILSGAGSESTIGHSILGLLWLLFISPIVFGLTVASLINAFKRPYLVEDSSSLRAAAKVISSISAALFVASLFLMFA